MHARTAPVAAVAAGGRAGGMAEVAATAEHTIDELVFTASDEAWFRNTISTPLGEFGGRYGIARFDGSNWQIPRATICQDLALAGGTCRPAAVRIEPTEPENWDDVMAEYDRMSELYGSWGDCLPEPFGPGRAGCDDEDFWWWPYHCRLSSEVGCRVTGALWLVAESERPLGTQPRSSSDEACGSWLSGAGLGPRHEAIGRRALVVACVGGAPSRQRRRLPCAAN